MTFSAKNKSLQPEVMADSAGIWTNFGPGESIPPASVAKG
jgi:hypothetical protein